MDDMTESKMRTALTIKQRYQIMKWLDENVTRNDDGTCQYNMREDGHRWNDQTAASELSVLLNADIKSNVLNYTRIAAFGRLVREKPEPRLSKKDSDILALMARVERLERLLGVKAA